MAHLTRDLGNAEGTPYFLWSEETTVDELRKILSSESHPERSLYIARLMREAQVTDVWKFLSPQQVADNFEAAAPHLGRKKDFWEYLLSVWKKRGAVQ